MFARAIKISTLITGISLAISACAPTLHVDAPSLPEPSPMTAAQCPRVERPSQPPLAPLDPPPQLPDADKSPCPLGSGLAACFTLDQDLVRQKRFKILHDDRDYCRDAYDRAVKRAEAR